MSLPDTGHPLGLWRVLIHDDGHVAGLTGGAGLNSRVEALHRLLTEVGLPGYRLGWLSPQDAVRAVRVRAGLPDLRDPPVVRLRHRD